MFAGIAALLGMVFIAFLIFQALNGNFPKIHTIFYLLSAGTALYAFIFFLSIDLNLIIKIAVSVILGIALVTLGTMLRRPRAG